MIEKGCKRRCQFVRAFMRRVPVAPPKIGVWQNDSKQGKHYYFLFVLPFWVWILVGDTNCGAELCFILAFFLYCDNDCGLGFNLYFSVILYIWILIVGLGFFDIINKFFVLLNCMHLWGSSINLGLSFNESSEDDVLNLKFFWVEFNMVRVLGMVVMMMTLVTLTII